jgi:hypothetical protein
MTDTVSSVPFYPQKWDLSQWKNLGFSSYDDAEYWEKSCCGILCIQMAVEHFLQKRYTTKELIDKGQELHGYSDALGWSHAGLVRLSESLGLQAVAGKFVPDQLAHRVESGGLAIVSIKWGFRSQKNLKEKVLFWKKYGGHLALVIGVERKAGKLTGFYVHHTSIREGYNWENRFVPLKDFKKGYTGRGIIVHI